MHEYTLASNLVETASRLGKEHGAARISRLICRVGAFDQIVPGVLTDAFELCAIGTVAADAELILEMERFRMQCRRCGHVGEADAASVSCPACGSADLSLLGNHGVTIVSMTVKTDDED